MFMQSHSEPRQEGLSQRLGRAAEDVRERYDRAGERAHDLARTASRRGRDRALATVAEVRRRPAPYGLAALVGVAALALWLSPRLRGDIAEGAGRLWNEVQKHKGALRL